MKIITPRSILFLLITACLLLLALTACSPNRQRQTLPPQVLETFNKAFPGFQILKVEKEVDEGQVVYEVEAKSANLKLELVYDITGTTIEMEELINMDAVPPVVKEGFAKSYPLNRVKTVERVTERGTVYYEFYVKDGFNKHEYLFDTNGNQVDIKRLIKD